MLLGFSWVPQPSHLFQASNLSCEWASRCWLSLCRWLGQLRLECLNVIPDGACAAPLPAQVASVYAGHKQAAHHCWVDECCCATLQNTKLTACSQSAEAWLNFAQGTEHAVFEICVHPFCNTGLCGKQVDETAAGQSVQGWQRRWQRQQAATGCEWAYQDITSSLVATVNVLP
jgi:hypothetical protein